MGQTKNGWSLWPFFLYCLLRQRFRTHSPQKIAARVVFKIHFHGFCVWATKKKRVSFDRTRGIHSTLLSNYSKTTTYLKRPVLYDLKNFFQSFESCCKTGDLIRGGACAMSSFVSSSSPGRLDFAATNTPRALVQLITLLKFNFGLK